MVRYFLLVLVSMIMLSGCNFGGSDDDIVVPTVAQVNSMKTAIVLTQNAPPPQFSTISYNPIDHNTDLLPGWHAEIAVNFDGQYADTGEAATGQLLMNIYEN